MPLRRPTVTGSEPRVLDVELAEAALMKHYARLVRLAYVTLPRDLGRHRRVLTAHGVVQRALPRRRPAVPGLRRTREVRQTAPAGYTALRTRVLRAAMAQESRSARLSRARSMLPAVWGLRVFPQPGGGEEMALDRALAQADWPVRAAVALLVLDEESAEGAGGVLRAVGVAEPEGAVLAARRLVEQGRPSSPEARPTAGQPPDPGTGVPVSALLAPEFDPCLLHARPTDLLRRRHRVRSAATAVLLAGCAVVTALALPDGTTDRVGSGRHGPASAAGAEAVRRTPPDAWADTARVDFTAWPARGARTDDRDLLERALRAWSDPDRRVRRSAEPGAASSGTDRPPRLLFAGDVDDRAVVLLHDDLTTVRYSEPLSGDGSPELVSALTEGADVTTAAAIVVSRSADATRLLLAPWIAEAGTRDLLAPDTEVRALDSSGSGVTGPVPVPSAGGDCRTWPVVQLRSSPRIAEDHAFLLTDLGGLSPAHLTYMPPPEPGERPRPPREATGPDALEAWARAACRLDGLRDKGVRAVNHWVFAQQELPERAGRATWVCARADTWRGRGRVEYLFLGPGSGAARSAGVRANTAECSRFGQDVVAGIDWRAPSGASYLLAAGSRSLTRVEAASPVRAAADGRFLAVRAPKGADAQVSGRLSGGAEVDGPR
ncbi:hypothetical protein [Streptomyces sp. NPDC126514]|uniref:hypothetical protein n=1 Tax=Streptomyces sp. NPDC126514 TaxID=3155210 RepID=UPI00332E3787